MTVILGGSGATNPPLIPDVLLTVSTTWSPPYKIKALVRCFGGGGSGALAQTNVSDKCWAGSGGGAGEHAGSILELDPSVTYTVVVGAGGLAKYATLTVGAVGNAGGNTSFAGSDVTTITANGGQGGTSLQMTTDSTAYSLSGAAGGAGGAGELYRHTGGAGGAITKPAGSNNVIDNALCTGGGGVGLFNTGFAGGAITWVTSASNNRAIATGGGGVNGAGGLVNTDSTNYHTTWGGSSFGPAPNNINALTTPGFGTTNNQQTIEPSADAWESNIDFWNGGSLLERVNHTFQQSYGALSPPGTGGMGRNGNNFTYSYGTGATLFAGGGAIASPSTAFPNMYQFMMGGKLGGGGGCGGMQGAGGSKAAYSGMGGHGGVLIEMLERIV